MSEHRYFSEFALNFADLVPIGPDAFKEAMARVLPLELRTPTLQRLDPRFNAGTAGAGVGVFLAQSAMGFELLAERLIPFEYVDQPA